jgi:hypothetical protein
MEVAWAAHLFALGIVGPTSVVMKFSVCERIAAALAPASLLDCQMKMVTVPGKGAVTSSMSDSAALRTVKDALIRLKEHLIANVKHTRDK